VRFHNHDGELAGNHRRRSFREEAEMALAAMDCVLHGDLGVYVSTQLTTGERLYALLRETGTRSADELKARLGEEGYDRRLWQPNLEAAAAFALRVRERLGGREAVVSPAPFSAPGWSQPEYLAFWDAFIRRRAQPVYFNPGWEYSRGCSYEYVVARDAEVPTFDAEGQPLEPPRAIDLLEAAIASLRADGLEPIGLTDHLAGLERTLGQPARRTIEEG
jgi:hypothetical protein